MVRVVAIENGRTITIDDRGTRVSVRLAGVAITDELRARELLRWTLADAWVMLERSGEDVLVYRSPDALFIQSRARPARLRARHARRHRARQPPGRHLPRRAESVYQCGTRFSYWQRYVSPLSSVIVTRKIRRFCSPIADCFRFTGVRFPVVGSWNTCSSFSGIV